MVKDPYASLGVKKSATQDEIKAAYRELAKKLHPDLNPGNKQAEQQFKEVNEAYTLLSDPKKREEFDRLGEAAFGGPGGPGQRGPFYYETQEPGRYSRSFSFEGSGFEDIFGSIFNRMGNRAQSGGGRSDIFGEFGAAPGQAYQIEVDFKDAVLGAEREVTLPDGRHFTIKIPPGVDSGTKLRLGRGSQEREVLIEIQVRPSSIFKRSGNNLEIELPISFSEAVLGGEVRVPVIDGDVILKIPPGVSTGSRLRLRGKGVTSRVGAKSGDQIVELKIVMPQKIDPELKEMAERWSKKHPYDPRTSLWRDLEREAHRAT